MYGKNELSEFLEKCVELPEMGYYDYEWDRFVSYYDPQSGMFYWVSDSGCSCNDLWDDIQTVGDMNVGRKEEFLNAAAYFGDGRYSTEFETVRQAVDNL